MLEIPLLIHVLGTLNLETFLLNTEPWKSHNSSSSTTTTIISSSSSSNSSSTERGDWPVSRLEALNKRLWNVPIAVRERFALRQIIQLFCTWDKTMNCCRRENRCEIGSVNLSRNYRIFSSPYTITELHWLSVIADGGAILQQEIEQKMRVWFVTCWR